MRAFVIIVGSILAGAVGLSIESPAPEEEQSEQPRCESHDGMVHVPAGSVLLGEDGPARPGRAIQVAEFWIDCHEVTNRQFAAFTTATGYRTHAEREGGSALFISPVSVAGMEDVSQWWRYVERASWRHPEGAGSDLTARENLPVVHVTYEDALAYARWVGRSLPDELQWERAARADQSASKKATEWAYSTAGRPIANTWQGVFPVINTGDDGYAGLAPVGCFPPNAYGIHDMIGNVWEWTTKIGASVGGGTRMVKGGSFLCSLNYCANFRAAAFQAQEEDFGTSHIGFRTIALVPPTSRPLQRTQTKLSHGVDQRGVSVSDISHSKLLAISGSPWPL